MNIPLSKHVSVILILMLLMTTSILSCRTDSGVIDSTTPSNSFRRYEFSMRSSQDSLSFSVLGVTQAVLEVQSPITWLKIFQNGNDYNGNTRLAIVRTADTPSTFSADSANIVFADEKVMTIVIKAADNVVPLSDNTSAYDSFNKEWWKQNAILLSKTINNNGMDETKASYISLPWANASISNIPPDLFIKEDLLNANRGWQMAYNLFAAQSEVYNNGKPHYVVNSIPYFMLYNKYTGTLRVFYYQDAAPGQGGELSFMVTPDMSNTPKFPYYHSLQYAIPMSNKDVQMRGNILNVTKGNNTFQQQTTPYMVTDVIFRKGWYCFDMDWSAYNPSLSAYFDINDRMSIDLHTANTTNITLAGSITGNSSGDIMQFANSSTSTANGVNYLDQFNSGTNKASEAIDKLMAGDYLGAAFKGVMSLWNIGKAMTGNATDDYTTETKSTGSINQSFTGKISLDGYSVSNTTNNAEGVQFSHSAFCQNNNVGEGVWSLQDNPIVYVLNDKLIGEDEDFTCLIYADKYGLGPNDPAMKNLRMMTFFDPTSIKFNINTKVFKDIRNAKMSWTYGVYPNQSHGHTDDYRIGLLNFRERGMIEEPEFIDKEKNKGKTYSSFFSADLSNMNYVEWNLEDMVTTTIDQSTKPKIYKQKDADYRYYANAGNDKLETDKDFFIVDPIVMLPTTFKNEEGMIYDFKAPDFVVGVVLSFDYSLDDGSKARAFFSKRFIPQVKSISTNQMITKRKELTEYVSNGIHQKVNGITIIHQNAQEMLTQFFSTSKFLTEYK